MQEVKFAIKQGKQFNSLVGTCFCIQQMYLRLAMVKEAYVLTVDIHFNPCPAEPRYTLPLQTV